LQTDIKSYCLAPTASMRDAIEKIDKGARKFVCVVDSANKLVGLVTDGDVRRALLSKQSMDVPIVDIMNYNPLTLPVGISKQVLLDRMIRDNILHIPIVNENYQLCDVAYLPTLSMTGQKNNQVIVMAGGMGKRLMPLTERVPKPMIKVGDRPLIQIIIENLAHNGFTNITLCVNYLAHVIKDFVGDGSLFGTNVSYVHENEARGTGGALSLLPSRPTEDFFIMNGDILTSIDFSRMLEFHQSKGSLATMAVNRHVYDVPFGVVKVDGENIVGFEEKPRMEWSVNSGIYVLSPKALDHLPEDQYFGLPDLFQNVIDAGEVACSYQLSERWMDIGRPEDLQTADAAFRESQSTFLTNLPKT